MDEGRGLRGCVIANLLPTIAAAFDIESHCHE
jgi:hypothetical protein